MKSIRLLNVLVVLFLITGCRMGRNQGQNPADQVPPASINTAAPAVTNTPGANGEYVTPNTYKVAVFDNYTVHDAKRNRDFPILIRYPVGAAGPLPVILWSHGGGYNNNGHHANSEWGNTLASAGYVVIHIGHVEDEINSHCALLQIPADECERSDFGTEVAEGGTLISTWYNKPLDGVAVLDDLDNIERASNLTFDRDRIGAAGHSGGTVMVMSLAGAVRNVSPSLQNVGWPDPRVKAFNANSPQGIGSLGYTETSWENITRPLLITTGKADGTPTEQPKDRLDPFQHMFGPDKYLLYVNSPEANHVTFALAPDGAPSLEPFVAATQIAFFDAYLRGLPEALAWLNSNGISLWSNGVATITTK